MQPACPAPRSGWSSRCQGIGAELTQAARAASGDSAHVKPYVSSLLTFAVIAAFLIIVALLVWFGSSLPDQTFIFRF